MAALRLAFVFLALVGFFLVGTPLQALIARVRPAAADRIPLFFCRSLLRLMRVQIHIEGTWPRGAPVMIVPNHVSWIDILGLGALTPFCFLAKSDVARWPVVSAFAVVQGTIFVDRNRRRSIPGANRAMAASMRAGRPVLLFPEGTTLAGPAPGRFHSSHFAAARDLLAAEPGRLEVLVQPVALTYSRRDAAWVGDEALLPNLWRVLRQPPLLCRIRFATPIAYRSDSDRKVVARDAREAVAAMLAASVEGVIASRRRSNPGVAADDLPDLSTATPGLFRSANEKQPDRAPADPPRRRRTAAEPSFEGTADPNPSGFFCQ